MEKLFYFAKVFDGLNTVGIVFMVIAAIVLCILIPCKYVTKYEYSYGGKSDAREDKVNSCSRWICRCWWILSIGIILTIFVPDKKTFLFMVGGKAVDTLVDKTDIEEIPGNTINLLNEYIKAETDGIRQRNHDEQRLNDRD